MRVRRYVLSLVVVLLLCGLSVVGLTVLNARPKLGLDLRGGVSVVLTARGEGVKADVIDKTVEIIRQRVNALGTEEPEISRAGTENIIVQLPGIKDPARAVRIIGKTAQLHFRPVLESMPEEAAREAGWKLTEADPPDQEVIFAAAEEGGGPTLWYKLGASAVSGAQIKDAFPQFHDVDGWVVQLEFNSEGANQFQAITAQLAPSAGGQAGQLSIVLDRAVESAPQVRQAIPDGRAQISGTFTDAESRDLALVLRTGALPIELEQSQVQRVSATLGRTSLNAGLLAGAIGLALVALFMFMQYRLLGLITFFGLGVFGCLVLGLIGFIGAVRGFTLTLAGIAGLIVAVGIAADSYIVYFERVKDELRDGKTFRSAVDRGFESAFRTNMTANAVAFFAAIILWLLAIGPVRGFALTLGIAAVFDILLLYFWTHPAVALIATNKRLAGLRAVGMREAATQP